ncbi:hypothetical protein ColLi_11338 [Colletotrichum liriopes]|uniref:Uncharacterized protein n=1 Tax=Colletotrichum liriopes TaxID=708192 RepID=A0AA37GXG9_9PEZI|nr:hypothetical protein ColLi_11338 [Colletotrichum liriopes]
MAMLLATYQENGLWDASDPKHRACYFGQPCLVTGDKLCARILYLAKHSHAYGSCSAFSGSEHEYCPPISDLERRWLFPNCSACGVLTEARGLVLIHRRMLDECAVNEKFTDTDVKCIKKSLAGYMRAYEIRRSMHLQELREQGQAAYELEMRYARGDDATQSTLGQKAGRDGWWKKTAIRAIKTIVRVFSI